MRHDLVSEAFELVKDLEPSTPQEYILKGVVHATLGGISIYMYILYDIYGYIYVYMYICTYVDGLYVCAGQSTSSREHMKIAQQCFQLVG